MAQQKIVLTQDSSKPVAALYAQLADHNRLNEVFGIPVKRIADGRPDINGKGSVRRIGFAPLAIEETVTDAQPNRSIDYKITRGGFPLKNHAGRLDFSETGSGSRVTWTIEFDSALPVAGSLVRLLLGQAIGRGLRRIA
jgi:hypothetical protein